jgi:hypothetical protein
MFLYREGNQKESDNEANEGNEDREVDNEAKVSINVATGSINEAKGSGHEAKGIKQADECHLAEKKWKQTKVSIILDIIINSN